MHWIVCYFGIAVIVTVSGLDLLRGRSVVSPGRAVAVAVISGILWPVCVLGAAQILALLGAERVLRTSH